MSRDKENIRSRICLDIIISLKLITYECEILKTNIRSNIILFSKFIVNEKL